MKNETPQLARRRFLAAAGRDSAAGRGKHPRRRLFSTAALAMLLAGCATFTAASPDLEQEEVAFERFEVVTGPAKHQTVLPGFFLGGPAAELAVVQVGESGERRLRMYRFDGEGWAPAAEAALRPGVSFVDVAEIGGRDRLITYERGRVSRLDPETGKVHPLVSLATTYNDPAEGEVPRLDITRDINRDGRDDLVVPDIDGFWISIQRSDGSFTEAVKLGPPEPFRDEAGVTDDGMDASRTYGEVGITRLTFPWYQGRVHGVDFDRDGRTDLAFWNEDHFDIHLQNERARFDPVARAVETEVAIESDGTYSRMFEFSDAGALSLLFGFGEKTRRTVLYSLRDLNGDRVADLVTLTLAGRSLLRQRSLYEVHFGTATPAGTAFARAPGTAIRPKGKAGALEPWGYSSQLWQDFDADGQVDVMFREVKIGFGGMVRALAANSVSMDLELYRMQDGRYPDRPTATRKIRPDLKPFGGRKSIFFPTALAGDVNGDGRSDLLVGQSREELHVFLGTPGPELLARQPQKVAVALPADQQRNLRLLDLDRDGKQDLLIHHPASDEPHRLTMLLAR